MINQCIVLSIYEFKTLLTMGIPGGSGGSLNMNIISVCKKLRFLKLLYHQSLRILVYFIRISQPITDTCSLPHSDIIIADQTSVPDTHHYTCHKKCTANNFFLPSFRNTIIKGIRG